MTSTTSSAPPQGSDPKAEPKPVAAGKEFEPIESGDPTRETLKLAERGRKLDEQQAQDALAWFHEQDDDPEAQIEPKELKLNMGTRENPRWIRWVIGPVEDTKITAIREGARKGSRRQRRAGEVDIDEMLVARRMVVEGTLEPNLREMAKAMKLVDPADAVQSFFRKGGKTGLITQLSGEILSISGWDDEDLQEVEAARG